MKNTKVIKIIDFIKTIPGIIASTVTVMATISSIFTLAVIAVINPIVERVDYIENVQKSNTSTLEEHSRQISEVRNEIMAEVLKIRIADMIERDFGIGDRRDFILETYDNLLEVCSECQSTQYEIQRYLASL